MSPAEAVVRQRAEADYQRAIDDAIRATAWREDDASADLVRELAHARQTSGLKLRSSVAGASGGFKQPRNAAGGYASAALDEIENYHHASPAIRLRDAMESDGIDLEEGSSEPGALLVQYRGSGGSRVRGSAGSFADAGAPIREFFFRQNMDAIRRLEPKNPALSYIRDPNIPISREGLASSVRELDAALARVTDRIAQHALKHATEFGNADVARLALIARSVITNVGSQRRNLQDGRTAFYDKRTNTLVIVNPYVRDQGTMMKPKGGQAYVDGLR